jgi:hypothetical protein
MTKYSNFLVVFQKTKFGWRFKMTLDNYELTTIDYALRYYLEQNPNLDEEDIEWCNLVREKVDSMMVSNINDKNVLVHDS